MNKNKLSYEFVKEYIENNNCLLISKTYKNVDTPLEIQCSCGKIFKRKFSSFRRKEINHCIDCRHNYMGKIMSNNLDDIKDVIAKTGCKLLSGYKNYSSVIEIMCYCGNTFKTTFSNFKIKKYQCCDECKKELVYQSYSLPEEEVSKYLLKYGCKLNSEYKRSSDKISIICSCGNIFEKNLNKFKTHKYKTCPECYPMKFWDDESVREFIEKDSNSGCKLLTTTYKDRKELLDIICECGTVFHVNFFNFLYGKQRKCKNCSSKDFSSKMRLSYCDVKDVVEAFGGKLLSDESIDRKQSLLIQCPCGNEFKRTYDSIKANSCFCTNCTSKNSKMELEAMDFFIENNINFKREYTFDDLRSKKGYLLRFDFAIFNKDKIKLLVEIDGEQHYRPIEFMGGKDKFNTLIENDLLKNNYCKKNKIKLVRIPYYEIDSLKDILNNLLC